MVVVIRWYIQCCGKMPQAERKTVLGFSVDNEGLYRSTVDTTGALDDAGTLTYRLNLMGENGDTYRDNVDSKRWNIAQSFSGHLQIKPR
jgi:iron complex outermembrane receptor protein